MAEAGRYTVHGLMQMYVWARAHEKDEVEIAGMWPDVILTGREWREWFRDCLNQKINRNEVSRGRKDSYEYEVEMRRAQRELNGRVIIHWLPKELRGRFAHRLRQPDEYC